MLIANPLYDVVFKYLMEDQEIAQGILSAIIGEDVVELHLEAQEQTVKRPQVEIYPHLLSLYRVDFVARIATSEGVHKEVLIEVQKARLAADLLRFREYLGKRYGLHKQVHDENGEVQTTSLPIIAVFILGFNLEEALPGCLRVRREYLNLITGEGVGERSEFVEQLSHDLYVIQAKKVQHRVSSHLELLLSVFGQQNFIDPRGHEIEYPEDGEERDEPAKPVLLKQMLRRLSKLRQAPEVKEKMALEDQMYAEFKAALNEKMRDLKGQLSQARIEAEEARRQKEAAVRREEEERRQKEEERRQKEEERRQKEAAVRREEEARKREEEARKREEEARGREEEAQRREEVERRQREEAQRQKEEAFKQKEAAQERAIRLLMGAGLTEAEARRQLLDE